MSKSPIIKSIFQVTLVAMLALTVLIGFVFIAEGNSEAEEKFLTREGSSDEEDAWPAREENWMEEELLLTENWAAEKNCLAEEGVSAVGFLTMPQIQVKPGDNIEIPVSVLNNPGLISCRFFVDFNSQWFTPVMLSRGNALGGGLFVANLRNLAGEGMFWFDLQQTGFSFDGEIFRLGLQVNPDAPPGSYPLTLRYAPDKTLDYQFEEVIWDNLISSSLEVISQDVSGILTGTEITCLQAGEEVSAV